MRKIITVALFIALAGALTVAAPQRDRDDHRDRDDRHDNGKHKGQEKREVRGDNDGHDNAHWFSRIR